MPSTARKTVSPKLIARKASPKKPAQKATQSDSSLRKAKTTARHSVKTSKRTAKATTGKKAAIKKKAVSKQGSVMHKPMGKIGKGSTGSKVTAKKHPQTFKKTAKPGKPKVSKLKAPAKKQRSAPPKKPPAVSQPPRKALERAKRNPVKPTRKVIASASASPQSARIPHPVPTHPENDLIMPIHETDTLPLESADESLPGPSSYTQLYRPAENEGYMNEAQQAHFRQLLLNWKHELLAESQRTVNNWQEDNVREAVDSVDVAAHEEALALAIRNRNREFRLVQKIEAAIRRLDNHEYGYCESCGNEIGLGRLAARLTAELCIDCKQIAEIKEKGLR